MAYDDIKAWLMQVRGVGETLASEIADVLYDVAEIPVDAAENIANDDRIMRRIARIPGVGRQILSGIFELVRSMGFILTYTIEDVLLAFE